MHLEISNLEFHFQIYSPAVCLSPLKAVVYDPGFVAYPFFSQGQDSCPFKLEVNFSINKNIQTTGKTPDLTV